MISDARRQIIAAFNRLLEHFPFESITTKMIVESANVSRSTFYRNFKDKHDVLCSNYDEIFSKAIENSHSFEDLSYNISLLYKGLGKVGNDIPTYDGANNYIKYVSESIYNFTDNIVKKARNGKGLDYYESIQCRILYNGGMTIWPKLSMDMTEEQRRQMSKIAADMLPESIRNITF